MSIKTIHYDVTADGISPAVRQKAGVQGDHNVTTLEFELSAPFYNSIINEANGRHLVYRFEGYDSVGLKAATQFKDLNESVVKYSLENWLTENGGDIKVVLVISAMDALEESALAFELYTFPAVLSLYDRPDGENVDVSNRTEVETLAEVARNAAAVADAAREAAITAQEKTEAAKAALEQGTEWVFNGGDASSNVDVDFVIDTEMSSSSENAVSNNVIKLYVDTEVEKLEEEINEKIGNNVDYIVEQDSEMHEDEHYGWSWRKWKSGTVELWGSCDVKTAFTTKVAEGHWEGKSFPSLPYPFPLINENGAIHVQFSVYYTAFKHHISYCAWYGGGSTTTPTYTPYSATQITDEEQVTGRYYVMARWK